MLSRFAACIHIPKTAGFSRFHYLPVIKSDVCIYLFSCCAWGGQTPAGHICSTSRIILAGGGGQNRCPFQRELVNNSFDGERRASDSLYLYTCLSSIVHNRTPALKQPSYPQFWCFCSAASVTLIPHYYKECPPPPPLSGCRITTIRHRRGCTPHTDCLSDCSGCHTASLQLCVNYYPYHTPTGTCTVRYYDAWIYIAFAQMHGGGELDKYKCSRMHFFKNFFSKLKNLLIITVTWAPILSRVALTIDLTWARSIKV